MDYPFEGHDRIEYFPATWAKETECEKLTDEAIRSLGEKAPLALPSIERVLAYLDAVASCAFGCSGGDHQLERLVFRCCNRARASVRLLRMGFYDESLMITRAIGETANLMLLFTADRPTVEAWKRQESWTRRPASVRERLEAIHATTAADQNRYNLLSGIAAHADPHFAPAAHNMLDRPIMPGIFSREGALLCLNELSIPVAFLTIPATVLFPLPDEVKTAVLQAGANLFRNVGGFTIDNQRKYWEEQRANFERALQGQNLRATDDMTTGGK